MLKKIILALGAVTAALGASSAAFAHGDDQGRGWGWGHEKQAHRYYAPRRVVVVPAPRVVYAPPPRVAYPYYAAPVFRPTPVYRPAPAYSQPSVSIRFDIPL